MVEPASPLAEALVRVGDRWTLLVVEALLDGPRRFSELGEQVGGIAPNILSQRLKHLEREGLVLAEPYTDRPPRFEYRLTAPGKELADALRALSQWGAQHTEAEVPRHDACGSPLEVRWWCPTCAAVADPDEADLRYV